MAYKSLNMLAERYHTLLRRIQAAEARYDRSPGSVRLIAISKTQPAARIRALTELGQQAFGESYAQEAIPKIDELQDLEIEWHFIGHIQSNKTQMLARHFHWVQSVDRLKIAERLNDQRPSDLAPLDICLQVNISHEPSKSGLTPESLAATARAVARLPRLRLRGLMAIPTRVQGSAPQRRAFSALRKAHDIIVADGIALDTLSMGMSDDFEAAIAEGATMVRVGTAIFGART